MKRIHLFLITKVLNVCGSFFTFRANIFKVVFIFLLLFARDWWGLFIWRLVIQIIVIAGEVIAFKNFSDLVSFLRNDCKRCRHKCMIEFDYSAQSTRTKTCDWFTIGQSNAKHSSEVTNGENWHK